MFVGEFLSEVTPVKFSPGFSKGIFNVLFFSVPIFSFLVYPASLGIIEYTHDSFTRHPLEGVITKKIDRKMPIFFIGVFFVILGVIGKFISIKDYNIPLYMDVYIRVYLLKTLFIGIFGYISKLILFYLSYLPLFLQSTLINVFGIFVGVFLFINILFIVYDKPTRIIFLIIFSIIGLYIPFIWLSLGSGIVYNYFLILKNYFVDIIIMFFLIIVILELFNKYIFKIKKPVNL